MMGTTVVVPTFAVELENARVHPAGHSVRLKNRLGNLFPNTDAAGRSCSIEAGKATVTCSSTGVAILLDKCAVPGVDASAIHLNDEACVAVAEGETHWKVESTTVAGCGATASFANDQFTFANTLKIGNGVVNGLVFGRNAAVNFVCNYNAQVSASSNFISSNIESSVSFDAGDVNENAIDFLFTFSFYETGDYQTTVDFSTSPVAVGSTLYGKTSVVKFGKF